MSKSYRKLITWCIIAIIGLYFGIKIYQAAKATRHDLEERLPSTFDLTRRDSLIICPSEISKFTVSEVMRTQWRDPITFVTYDNRFDLTIFSSPLTDNIDLDKLVLKESGNSSLTVDESYAPVRIPETYKFYFRHNRIEPVSQLILRTASATISTVAKGDSLLCLYIKGRNLSLRYSENGAIETFIEPSGWRTKVQLCLLFIKEHDTLDIVVIGNHTDSENMPTEAILKLFTDCKSLS